MKAIRVNEFGGPEVLKIQEVPDPRPDRGQVLVRVKAAGVNPVDTYIRAGVYARKPALPYTPGTDAAGVVEAVGADVKRVKPGDRVYVNGTITGAYAELALCEESRVHLLPPKISVAQGAALGVPYGTAFRALFQRTYAKPGETILVHGASGGVGTACVQFGRATGLTVIGTAGTDKGRALVKQEGAHHVVDHRAPDHADQIMAITEGGRVVVVGNRGTIEINPRDAMIRESSILGLILWAATDAELASSHAGILAGLESGTLRPIVGRELPLAEAPRAHHLVMEAGSYGKIVLIP